MSSSPAIERARDILRYCDSYSRMPKLIELAWPLGGDLKDREWLTLLGEEWSSCDNISLLVDDLWDTPFGLLAEFPTEYRHWMMTAEERTALELLPETVTIYRGCYANNKRGLSWSLSRATAERFPMTHRYLQKCQPLLVRAEVPRSQILALKFCRNESEVIAIRPKIRAISHIRA